MKYQISDLGQRKLDSYRDSLSSLGELGVSIDSLMNEDNNINALSFIDCNLDDFFSQEDFDSDVHLFEITASSTIESLLKVGLIREV